MSDSAQWWVIALLVVFMVGGLLSLILLHLRQPAPVSIAPSADHDIAGVIVARSTVRPSPSAADVSASRGPYVATAIATTTTTDPADIDDDIESPRVGSELSDRRWASAPPAVRGER